jgi:hypothetical protein
MNKTQLWSSIISFIFCLIFILFFYNFMSKEFINIVILTILMWLVAEKLYDRENQID